MRAAMKALTPALLLALGACGSLTPTDDEPRPIAKSPTGQMTNSQQSQQLQNQGVINNPSSNGETLPAGLSATRAVTIDPNNKFEYADVYTTLGDPTGMRELVPYLLKPEVWTLIKCEMLSDTEKHYRFQKVSTGTGRVMPEVDIFKTKR